MTRPVPSPHSPAPSRYSNPFATCWTKPGAIPYQFPDGLSAEMLIARLEAANWWGEIVGPHGAGKSTLLATLLPKLTATGRDVAAVALHASERRLPHGFLRRVLDRPAALVVVDGYELLSVLECGWLRWRCRRAAAGLLVTSHTATGLPTLIRLEPDLEMVSQLVTRLTRRVPSVVSFADVAASHACHGSNVRETLFDLYNCHERLSGARRTAMARPA